MQNHIQNVKIVGVGAAVPSRCVSISELLQESSKEDAFKIKRTAALGGLSERHVASEHEVTSDLCIAAAKDAMKKANWNPSTIDSLFCVTMTPDSLLPSMGYKIHAELGLSQQCSVQDMIASCGGLVQGLWCTGGHIGKERLKRVLVVAGDTMSKILRKNDIGNTVLFGDAAGAVALEYSEAPHAGLSFLLDTFPDTERALCSHGSGYEKTILEAGFHMDGAVVASFTQEKVPANILRMLQLNDISVDDIDMFVMHQPNISLLRGIAKKLEISMDKLPTILHKYGNCSCASTAVALCSEGKKILPAVGKTLWCGFGGGFSVVSMLAHLESHVISDVRRV